MKQVKVLNLSVIPPFFWINQWSRFTSCGLPRDPAERFVDLVMLSIAKEPSAASTSA